IYYIKQQLKKDYNDENIDFYNTPEIHETWFPQTTKHRYFWVNISKKEYEKDEGIVLTDRNEDGNRSKTYHAFNTIKVYDKAVFYEVGPTALIRTLGFVSKIEYDDELNRRKIY